MSADVASKAIIGITGLLHGPMGLESKVAKTYQVSRIVQSWVYGHGSCNCNSQSDTDNHNHDG